MLSFRHIGGYMDNSCKIPRHIAIILDGNGRWAEKRGLPRFKGHSKGSETVRDIVDHCNKIGIEYITLYAFSTENWKRPKEEVDEIMRLLRKYLDEIGKYADKNAKITVLGETEGLPSDIRGKIMEAIENTRNNTGIKLNIALNYGGRQEITNAAKKIASLVKRGELEPEDITENLFEKFLYTGEMPSPDIILRPGGEKRISNFLLWQGAYSELIFEDVLWPDFTKDDLDRAIDEFNHRNRRYGGVN